jgi:ABC-type sugar transport system substrate-binding protein
MSPGSACTTIKPHIKHQYEMGCAVCDEDVEAVLAAAAPYIVAATLRQAANRYTTEVSAAIWAARKALGALGKDATLGQNWDSAVRIQAAEGVAAVLLRWAEEVQP